MRNNAAIRMLTSDKVPYLLTVLVTLLGYTVTHTADRLTVAPLVEYNCSSLQSQVQARRCADKAEGVILKAGVSCTITNLSRATLIDDLHLSILPHSGMDITGERFSWRPPLTRGDSEPTEACTPKSAEFTVPQLPPGGAVNIDAGVSSPSDARLVIAANANVRFESASLITFLVRHEIEALEALTVLWLFSMAAIAWAWSLAPDMRRGSPAFLD